MRVAGLDAKSACVGLVAGICAVLAVGAQQKGAAANERRIADYHIAAEVDMVALTATVKKRAAQGWEPVGGVTFLPPPRPDTAGAFLQTMIRR